MMWIAKTGKDARGWIANDGFAPAGLEPRDLIDVQLRDEDGRELGERSGWRVGTSYWGTDRAIIISHWRRAG